jgi:hypothetical protein
MPQSNFEQLCRELIGESLRRGKQPVQTENLLEVKVMKYMAYGHVTVILVLHNHGSSWKCVTYCRPIMVDKIRHKSRDQVYKKTLTVILVLHNHGSSWKCVTYCRPIMVDKIRHKSRDHVYKKTLTVGKFLILIKIMISNNNDITSLAAPLHDLDLTTSPMNVETAGPSVCTAPQIKPST